MPCGKKLLIKDNVLKKFNAFKQLKKKDKEAGGILVGQILIETGNYVIDNVTTPMAQDKRTRHRFSRKSQGHQEYYNYLFHKNDRRYFYLGEWHTHPERIPSPSFTDKRNWHRISNFGFENEYLFFIILGTIELKVWSINKSNRKIVLLDRERK